MATDKRGGAIAVSIPEHLFASPAYRALGPLERCLMTELLAVARRVGTEEPLNISYDFRVITSGWRFWATSGSRLGF
jgi:hypothetical protein